MSELHHIVCTEKSDFAVTLRVYIVHVDESEFYQKKNYALQLLWYNANPELGTFTPLGNAIPTDTFFDTNWVNQHCGEFIESLKIIETKNYPVSPDLSFSNSMSRLDELPMAIILITVTNPKWIEHIQKGATWKSAAYDYGGQ